MTDPSRIVLASRSPRRADAMKALGYTFSVEVSDVEERMQLVDPCDPVPIAVAKVRDIAGGHRSSIVVGADTIVEDHGLSLGKPHDAADAVAMLRRLRGRTHYVRTGVAVWADDVLSMGEVQTGVVMRDYSDAEIDEYVAAAESLDCAGSYDARGRGAELMEPITGCVSAVIGFPVVALTGLLVEVGVLPPVDATTACRVLIGAPCRSAATGHPCAVVKMARIRLADPRRHSS